MSIDDRVVITPTGPRVVLVVTPTERICVGHSRLQQLREKVSLSSVDDELVAAGRRHARVHGFIMRGTSSDGVGTWRFDPSMRFDEQVELAKLVIRGHMPFKRMLFLAGCHDSIYTDWPDHEVAVFTKAATSLRSELQRDAATLAVDTLEGKRARIDRWIVERITFYQSVTVEQVVTEVLPGRIQRREQRRTQLDELLGPFPAEEIAGV